MIITVLKKNFFILLVSLFLLILTGVLAFSAVFPTLAKKTTYRTGYSYITRQALIDVSNISTIERKKLEFLTKSLANNLKLSPYVGDYTIILTNEIPIDTNENTRAILSSNKEAYILIIYNRRIKLIARSSEGFVHGITRIEWLLQRYHFELPLCKIFDYPDLKVRALHIVLRGITVKTVRSLIHKARLAFFNTLIIAIPDSVKFNILVRARLVDKNAISTKTFINLVRFARENGLSVVPEIKFLSHQPWLLKDFYPQLMYNKWTYNPNKKELYEEIIFPLLREIIRAIHPKAIHIGHDEVVGHLPYKRAPYVARPLPPDLFLKDVLILHKFLKKHNIQTWMWGDMLISPQDVNELRNGYLHGGFGFSAIRKKLPRDIVICDWQYRNNSYEFPSTALFAKEGFKVIGASWRDPHTIRAFSHFIYQTGPNALGMIATTWFYVQQKKWGIVDRIINVSGNCFWNAGHLASPNPRFLR